MTLQATSIILILLAGQFALLVGGTASPTPAPTSACPMYTLDFNDLPFAAYVTDEAQLEYGVVFSASAGNSGYDAEGPRVFDSANPGNESYGDPDLGSPNEACDPPGPGIGADGAPGEPFENCRPLGHMLIIQEGGKDNKKFPNDARTGGNITFTFDVPVEFDTIVIADTDGAKGAKVYFYCEDGSVVVWDSPTTGDNGVVTQMWNVAKKVNSLVFATEQSGAVAELTYRSCHMTGTPTSGPTASPSSSPTRTPTGRPSGPGPIPSPTGPPTAGPTSSPTSEPTSGPTSEPTSGPTSVPSSSPSDSPSSPPTAGPTASPTAPPTAGPTYIPTGPGPTSSPTNAPTEGPTSSPTTPPTNAPTAAPTKDPISSPTAAPTKACPLFLLDFYKLARGEYVTNQLATKFGVTIQAIPNPNFNKGYAPNGAARVFDTAIPSDATGKTGDPDLGSPNESCGGPGVGAGGMVGMPFANCDVLGKALIIQEKKRKIPDDSHRGGKIRFSFAAPVELFDVVHLDTDSDEGSSYEIEYAGGAVASFAAQDTGNNGVATQTFNKQDVSVLTFNTTGSGGVSSLLYRYCPAKGAEAWNYALEKTPSADGCSDHNLDFSTLPIGDYIGHIAAFGVTVTAYAPGAGIDDAFLGLDGYSARISDDGLIVQQADLSTTNATTNAATFRFAFDDCPVFVESLELDTDGGVPTFLFYLVDGTTTSVWGTNTGYSLETFNIDGVREMWALFPGGEATVVQLNYKSCP